MNGGDMSDLRDQTRGHRVTRGKSFRFFSELNTFYNISSISKLRGNPAHDGGHLTYCSVIAEEAGPDAVAPANMGFPAEAAARPVASRASPTGVMEPWANKRICGRRARSDPLDNEEWATPPLAP